MKKFITLTGIAACVLMFAACSSSKSATKQQQAQQLADHINNRTFTFEASEALPTTGRAMQLTSYYDMKLSHDTLVSSLPYFGRAFTAPLDPSKGGYNFTSTNIEYMKTDRDGGGWDIVIVPKDRNDGERFLLTAFSNGSATLQINSNNRQPISFRGHIK